MKRAPKKKAVPDTKDKNKAAASIQKPPPKVALKKPKFVGCWTCQKQIPTDKNFLVIEEDLKRVFCTEKCISDYFTKDIEALEQEYLSQVSKDDLSVKERESLVHLRWSTFESPQEIWCRKLVSGDHLYTLISQFDYEGTAVWCLCQTLFLQGEPSFLFIAFVTKDPKLVTYYRQGESIEWVNAKKADEKNHNKINLESEELIDYSNQTVDGVTEEWTEDETLRAEFVKSREDSDIQVDDFNLYNHCLQETLEDPTEVWALDQQEQNNDNENKVFYFIKHFSKHSDEYWYITVARETEEEDTLEVLDAFPTNDQKMVQRFRIGQEQSDIAETLSNKNSIRRVLH